MENNRQKVKDEDWKKATGQKYAKTIVKKTEVDSRHYEHDWQRKRTKYTVPHSTLNNCYGR